MVQECSSPERGFSETACIRHVLFSSSPLPSPMIMSHKVLWGCVAYAKNTSGNITGRTVPLADSATSYLTSQGPPTRPFTPAISIWAYFLYSNFAFGS